MSRKKAPARVTRARRAAASLLRTFHSSDDRARREILKRLTVAHPHIGLLPDDDLRAGADRIQLKHMLHLVAHEAGFASWEAFLFGEPERTADVRDFGGGPAWAILHGDDRLGDGTLTRGGKVRVTLESIGEGRGGDFDPKDEDDFELLRFSVDMLPADEDERERLAYLGVLDGGYGVGWQPVANATYCTQLPATIDGDTMRRALVLLMNEVYEPLTQGLTIKSLAERLSWISKDSIETGTVEQKWYEFTKYDGPRYADGSRGPAAGRTEAGTVFRVVRRDFVSGDVTYVQQEGESRRELLARVAEEEATRVDPRRAAYWRDLIQEGVPEGALEDFQRLLREAGVRVEMPDRTSFEVLTGAEAVDGPEFHDNDESETPRDEVRLHAIRAMVDRTAWAACGRCDGFHPIGFTGDCRDKTARLPLPPEEFVTPEFREAAAAAGWPSTIRDVPVQDADLWGSIAGFLAEFGTRAAADSGFDWPADWHLEWNVRDYTSWTDLFLYLRSPDDGSEAKHEGTVATWGFTFPSKRIALAAVEWLTRMTGDELRLLDWTKYTSPF